MYRKSCEYYEYERFRDDQREPSCFWLQNNAFLPHFHSAIELMAVHRGEMQVTVDGQTESILPGQLAVIPSFSIHTFRTPAYSESTVLIVPLGYLGPYEKRFGSYTFSRFLLTDEKAAACIAGLLTQLLDMGGQEESLFKRGLVYQIIGLLAQKIPLKKIEMGASHERLKDILDYLQGNFTSPVTLAGVAQRFGYSQSRFSHLFNEAFGCSLPQYVNMLRLKFAVDRMQEEGCPALEAALGAGYENSRSFYRAFRQVYGTAPSEYLKNRR